MSSFLFLLLQSETLTFKKHARASESPRDVIPVETWSSKAMGKSVAAYLLFKSTAPPGQWIQKLNVKAC